MEYSWYVEGDNLQGMFDSLEDASAHALDCTDEDDEAERNRVRSKVRVGPMRPVDVTGIVTVEDLEGILAEKPAIDEKDIENMRQAVYENATAAEGATVYLRNTVLNLTYLLRKQVIDLYFVEGRALDPALAQHALDDWASESFAFDPDSYCDGGLLMDI